MRLSGYTLYLMGSSKVRVIALGERLRSALKIINICPKMERETVPMIHWLGMVLSFFGTSKNTFCTTEREEKAAVKWDVMNVLADKNVLMFPNLEGVLLYKCLKVV